MDTTPTARPVRTRRSIGARRSAASAIARSDPPAGNRRRRTPGSSPSAARGRRRSIPHFGGMCGETLGSISRRASLLPHNKRLYRQPNCIERVFGRLKINRGRRYLPFLFVPVFLVVPGASRVSPLLRSPTARWSRKWPIRPSRSSSSSKPNGASPARR